MSFNKSWKQAITARRMMINLNWRRNKNLATRKTLLQNSLHMRSCSNPKLRRPKKLFRTNQISFSTGLIATTTNPWDHSCTCFSECGARIKHLKSDQIIYGFPIILYQSIDSLSPSLSWLKRRRMYIFIRWVYGQKGSFSRKICWRWIKWE